MQKCLALLLVSMVMLSSCFFDKGRRVRGNGNIVSQTRSVTGFQGVESHGSYDIYLTCDSNYSVRVEGDENILPIIRTTVEGGNLRIEADWGYSIRTSRTIKVYVTAPRFNTVQSSGSGNVVGSNLIRSDEQLDLQISGSGSINLKIEAEEVAANISGSGSIDLAGSAASMQGTIAGSGDIRASGLRTSRSKLSIAGSGNAIVHADQELDAHIAGSGDVRYSGNPTVNSQIAGSGSVRKSE